MSLEQEARKIIEENMYCSLGTASRSGLPWVSPVWFAYDKDYTFFWYSRKDAVHSMNILENKNTAIVLFNSTVAEGQGNGVYLETLDTLCQDPRSSRI